MKKVIAILVIFLCAGAALSAQMQMSAGVVGSYTSAFGGGYEGSLLAISYEYPYSGGGFHAFFDVNYAELSVGLFSGSLDIQLNTSSSSNSLRKIDLEGLIFGLLGKYPIDLEFMTFFPTVGIEYLLITKGTYGNTTYTDADKFSHLWIKFGVGADFSVTERIYVRGTVLYGIRLESELESDNRGSADPLLGHGLQIKIAVGFNL
ncbi:MAG: hypothetical protein FWC01_03955 [Treponema sp.]|nr:hypothetical protein [Treponema sp.]MCL2237144.1 hypothetical protein [Treponema sp.]